MAIQKTYICDLCRDTYRREDFDFKLIGAATACAHWVEKPAKSPFGCDTAGHLADEIEALSQPWQPIKTAPRDSKPVLVFEPGHMGGVFKAHLRRMMNKQDEWINHGTPHKLRPTHWMPLPAGPNVRGNSQPMAAQEKLNAAE